MNGVGIFLLMFAGEGLGRDAGRHAGVNRPPFAPVHAGTMIVGRDTAGQKCSLSSEREAATCGKSKSFGLFALD